MAAQEKKWTAADMLERYRGNLPRSVKELDEKLRPVCPPMHETQDERERVFQRIVDENKTPGEALAKQTAVAIDLHLLAAIVADIDQRLSALENFVLED